MNLMEKQYSQVSSVCASTAEFKFLNYEDNAFVKPLQGVNMSQLV